MLTRPLLPAAAVCCIAFWVRVQNIEHRSIWMDEDSQARVASSSLGRIAFRAAAHHQPPIDYYLEKATLLIFGYSEIGARIHAVIWSALATGLFFLLLLRQMRHLLAVGMGSLIFLVQPDLVRYAVEGRPISCGLFFSTLFIYVVSGYFSAPAADREQMAWRAKIFVSAFLLMLSVGFQPIVLILSIGLGLLPVVIHAPSRRSVFYLWGVLLLAVISSLPILWLSISKGSTYLGTASLLDRLDNLVDALIHVDLKSFHQKYMPFLSDSIPLLSAALPLAVVAWKTAGRTTLSTKRCFFLALIVSALIYPLIFDTLFKGIIDYQIQLRYYLTFAPLLVFLAALLLDEALKGITAISRSRFSPIVPALWALLGIFSLLSFNHAVDGIMDRNKTSIRTDWRSLYALLDTLPQGSNAYLFNIVPVDRWSPPRFYATRFYYPKDGPHKVKLFTRDWLLPHYRDAEALWENDLVIVVPYGFSSIRPVLFSKMKQVVAYRFTQMSVVRIRFDGEMRHRVREVFEVLAEHLTKTEAHYKVFETVGWMRLLDGDRAGAREMIRILQAMDLRGMLLPEVITPLIAGVSHFKNM